MKQKLFFLFALLNLAFLANCSSSDDQLEQRPQPKTIEHLRKVTLSPDLKFGATALTAVVVSDPAQGNTEHNYLVVQDKIAKAAIVLELTNAVRYKVGEVVEINLEGATLQEVDGEKIVKNISGVNVKVTGEQLQVAPIAVDLSTLKKEVPYWGPILVVLDDLQVDTQDQTTWQGSRQVSDGIATAALEVRKEAQFADQPIVKKLATLAAIARMDEKGVRLMPRSLEDMTLKISELKEDFEQSSSSSYDVKSLLFRTGEWIIDGGITAATDADPKNGAQSIRLQGHVSNELRKGILSMNFDLDEPVQTLKIHHGIYPAKAEVNNENPTLLSVEISMDQGATYHSIGEIEVDTKSKELKVSEFKIEEHKQGKMRFRVVNISQPFENGNRPRVNIDDIIFGF
ncbi:MULTISPECIES: DUF5689 domain-containing protein [unclassified Myroides]|uniref:DUF5689 domain-containing protein n=1 Tax=unclassified Myroides TaxID=2642485 RepID=UPI0015FDF09D|nr:MULTISPECIES: DUF5689 domain-containing protein [unclassified Myroides]MBB1151170.1 hypothetical protein [Myroides sp. NP-2]MDM1408704.1 hypothetical protein [Myroides sp. DF42-4-2]